MIKTVIPKSVEEVYAWIDNVRQNSDSYVTNFYAGQGSIKKWIEWKQLEYFNQLNKNKRKPLQDEDEDDYEMVNHN